MSNIAKTFTILAVAAGFTLLGAAPAQAYSPETLPPVPASWFTDSTACHGEGMNAIQGTVQLPSNTNDYRYSFYTTGTLRSVVLTAYPLDPAPDRNIPTVGYDLQEHYWQSPVCPPEPVAPAPAPEVVAPVKQTVKAPTTYTAPTTQTTTKTAPTVATPTTETVAPETVTPVAPVSEPSPSETPPATLVTAASTSTDSGGNLIIPIGGAVLLAGALTTLGVGVGKLGWFRK